MIEITALLVKELRERTGIGMMDCKIALKEANGDIDLAINNMRKSGIIKAAKKASKIAADGVIKIKVDKGYAIILEINCQTDFVTKDKLFQSFAEEVLQSAFLNKVTDIEKLNIQFKEDRASLIAKFGEKIEIRRIAILEGSELYSYQHGTRIGVIVSTICANEFLRKQIAMHIAASNPEFIEPEKIPANIIQKEYQLQMDIAIKSGKKREIAEKIIEGRINKFVSEISLTSQMFVMDPSKTVDQVLKEKGASVIDFIRFEVGEGIKKTETNFIEEVAMMSKRL